MDGVVVMEADKEVGSEAEIKAEDKEPDMHFEILMNDKILYDYLVYHNYSKFSGILSVCFGVLGLLFFAKTMEPVYLALAILLILYLPINLKYRSKVQMMNSVFKKPLVYDIGEKGITVSQDDVVTCAEWDKCTKAVSTRQSIVVYTGKRNACIFPRKQLGENLPGLLALLGKYMDPKKMKVRY